jgi:predicted helicase
MGTDWLCQTVMMDVKLAVIMGCKAKGKMNLNQYIETIHKRFQSGIAREHAYRADLESLVRELVPNIEITNEPANVTDCGNPDYVITKGKIPIGFIEAKDLGKDLNDKQYKPQFDRYRKALDNLIITDYLWFQFYQNDEMVAEIRIGDIRNSKIEPLTENFAEFTARIQNFCTFIGQTIKSPKKLAEMMAAKAKLLQMILEKAIESDEKSQENSSLQDQYTSFKSILIHDLNPKDFADIYAQTLAYGMFAARLHDQDLDTFSRQEAAELIPKTNPFLRKLFQYIAGYDIDERIKTTVDNLADVFRATDIKALLKNFGRSTQTQDPIIHFYETFLAEFDPKLRRARGVWYTPEPVVSFIVRSVDEILKTEFGLKEGLADTSRTTIEVEVQGAAVKKGNKPIRQRKEVHKVQVLDPATGTGTFLAEVVKHIYNNKFAAMQGAWSGYVEEHLIPRLNGFEILMASYAMAHLKLDMLLSETGYESTKDQRFNIFLTNSLEEHHPDTGTLFSSWLSTEANEANFVKRDTPVMVVMGNPPYKGESANKGPWIMKLMEDYKKEPGGIAKLNERNPKWINDDYVKFIRYGQHFIEKNGSGILAFINPHGFLDNPTFRGMRWNLLKTYDKIYTLDLHGNRNKKETAPDGSLDVNVFDIEQGVSINFFIKTDNKKKNELGEIYHYGLFGERETKYNFLCKNSMLSVDYYKIPNVFPNYFMVNKNFVAETQFNEGFSLNDLFLIKNIGIVTSRDHFVISMDKNILEKRIEDFFVQQAADLHSKYKVKENKSWKIDEVKRRAKDINKSKLLQINYRPFDTQYIYYDDNFIERSRKDVMQHYLAKNDNVGLLTTKAFRDKEFAHAFVTNNISEAIFLSGTTASNAMSFPLYLYSESAGDQQNLIKNNVRKPNLNPEIIEKIAVALSLSFVWEKLNGNNNTFSPIDLLDYVYASLHSPMYRDTYKEFLKIDFPRIPYPKNRDTFWQLVQLGGQLRQIHLLESPLVEKYITSYPKDGDNIIIRKIIQKDWELYDTDKQLGRVWINDNQYFDLIPLIAWEFYIGGYQPAQKWLKDRTGRKLCYEDILHYQKIIKALTETDRLMKEIGSINRAYPVNSQGS